jgi:hypothetical protein
MTKFDIAWPRRYFQRHRHEETWLLEAVLCERRLLDGRPQMQTICRLPSIPEEHANPDGVVEVRDAFWHNARTRLGRLYRLTDRDLDEIEALLAQRVPKPQPVPSPPRVRRACARTPAKMSVVGG